MKIYTRSGDDGKTGLFHGPRVPKDHVRIEAYGTVDELSSAIGVARAFRPPEDVDQVLERLQYHCFALGAELATPEPEAHGTDLIGPQQTEWAEKKIDEFDDQLSPLTTFILPAGSQVAASLHLARVVCRRAERRVVTLAAAEDVPDRLSVYLNRVSDLLFVLARYANKRAGRDDVPWKPDLDGGQANSG